MGPGHKIREHQALMIRELPSVQFCAAQVETESAEAKTART
jgi:hypothetical protein